MKIYYFIDRRKQHYVPEKLSTTTRIYFPYATNNKDILNRSKWSDEFKKQTCRYILQNVKVAKDLKMPPKTRKLNVDLEFLKKT